jgi:lipopolysaccharide/colanic/teichoic acid biosynthesis glycosyltransferase
MSAGRPAEVAPVNSSSVGSVGSSSMGLARGGTMNGGHPSVAAARHASASTALVHLHPGAREPRRGHLALRAIKRVVDIVAALVGLVVAAPVVALLAALIRLDSRGPVLFRQTRIGRDGKPFELVKLRSMVDGARVTRVGRFLRPMGLDELPQLWNVLTGHMSVVGPRPERPHLVDEYQATLPGYADRHVVRPGITGWAQIHGLRGGERPISERLRFDLEYVRTWNPARDLLILALTLNAVWRDTRRELSQ